MNSKLTLCATCCAALLLTASFAVGAPRGGGHGHGGNYSSMRGGQTFTRGGTGTWGGRQWSGSNRSGRNWSGTSGNWSGSNWSGGNWRHHRSSNNVIFVGDFGFPYWGWGYPYGYGYPYDYYGYGYGGYGYDPYGYGYGYNNDPGYGYGDGGYGYGDRSRVVQLQRRLARAGYYHGAIDGIMGPGTRRAIRAYERDYGRLSMR